MSSSIRSSSVLSIAGLLFSSDSSDSSWSSRGFILAAGSSHKFCLERVCLVGRGVWPLGLVGVTIVSSMSSSSSVSSPSSSSG